MQSLCECNHTYYLSLMLPLHFSFHAQDVLLIPHANGVRHVANGVRSVANGVRSVANGVR